MSGSSKKAAVDAVRKSLLVTVLEAKGLSIKSADKPHYFCVVSVNNVHFNTNIVERGQKPEWKQKFTFVEAALQAKDAQLRVILFHKNGPKDTVVGEADFSLSDLTPNQAWKEWHSIGEDKGKAKILLEINLLTDAPSSQKRKNRMNESLTRRISWGAKQTSTAAVVSPTKKQVDSHDNDNDTTTDEEGDAAAAAKGKANGDSSNLADSASKKRRASAFDYVGTGTDAENYEDQFKAAYHDETDMEDAFATDDTKDLDLPIEDISDAPATVGDGGGGMDPTAPAHSIDDSTETGSTKIETKKSKHSSPAKSTSSAPTSSTAQHAEAANGDEPSDAESGSQTEPASAEAAPTSTPAKVRKEKKSKKKQPKPVKAMPALAEATDEEDDAQPSLVQTASSSSIDRNSGTAAAAAPTVVSPASTPQRKKSVAGGLRGFLQKLGGGRSKKHNGDASLEPSTSNPSLITPTPTNPAAATSTSSSPAPIAAATATSSSVEANPPKSPRGQVKVKLDPYDAMHAELKSFVAMERAYLQDLTLLLDEYLVPAKKSNLDIIVALTSPTTELLEQHAANLKIIEKKMKDDHVPFGSYFDDLLAAVSDSYKLYRSKQVLLLSLLDSSPTEKSMTDHAAISNWIQTRTEAHEEAGKPIAPLQELILAPMHRLTNLAFVLERLLDVTPHNHPDSTNIRKVAARAHLLHAEVTSRGTTYRSMAKLSEIDAMLEFSSGAPSFLLADESAKRSYLLEGPLDHLELNADQFHQFNRVHIFLFNDLALLCKQLAKTPEVSRTTSPSKATSSSAPNGGPTTPRRHNSTTNAAASIVSSLTPNKYIVISRLKLDRIFLVDPEDNRGELTTFNNAIKNSTNSVSKPNASADGLDGANAPDLEYLDRLLEVVEMGVCIHRFRFESKDDKKLWLATLNSALSGVKPAFNVNERQYLYKLLMTQDELPPIVSALPEDPTQLTSWPLSRFTASIASRQLLERLHSTVGHLVNLHPSPTASPVPTSESEMTVVKQEVATLKKEHQRQLADATSRHEMDQLEITRLHRLLKEKNSSLPSSSTDTPAKGRKNRERSSTMDTNDSVGSGKGGGRKKAVALAESRAEEYLHKYLDLLESSTARDKKEENMMRRMEAAESMMKEQTAQFGNTMRQMSVTMDQNQREMAELRKQLQQQQLQTQALIDQLMLANMRNEKSPIVSPTGGPGIGATSPTIPRTNSGVKPPVPGKGVPGTPTSSGKVTVAGGSSSPGPASPSSWRGSAPAQGAAPDKTGSGSGTPSGSPHSAIPPSVASRGKRPSSVSLIAAAPIESPSSTDSVAVANSADSSESSASGPGGAAAAAAARTPAGGSGASSPALFGTTGKTPSRLNLSTAVSSTGSTATPPNGQPVSPGGRGKERKLKNVRFPANGEEAAKASWASLARKKLGLSSTKTKPPKEGESPKEGVPWRQPPSSGTGTGSDTAVQLKKPNKIDWSQAKAESYFSDDLGSDYDPNFHMSPSDFERLQDEQMAPDDGSDYSEEAAA